MQRAPINHQPFVIAGDNTIWCILVGRSRGRYIAIFTCYKPYANILYSPTSDVKKQPIDFFVYIKRRVVSSRYYIKCTFINPHRVKKVVAYDW